MNEKKRVKDEQQKSRREFLKWAGATVVGATVAGAISKLPGRIRGNRFTGIAFAGKSPEYEVYALKYAGAAYPNYCWYWMGHPVFTPNQPITESAFYYWVIKGPDMNILFDTGVTPETAKAKAIMDYEDPKTVLGKLDLKFDDIDVVITSHAHWDHSNGLRYFPNATHYIQEACFNWTVQRSPQYEQLRKINWPMKEDIRELVKLNNRGKLKLMAGVRGGAPIEIVPGVSGIRVDGHYMGCQGLIVKTAAGPVVLASDSVYFYDNYERDWPGGICHERQTDHLDGMRRYREILRSGGILVPGHDMAVLKKFPLVTGGVVKIA